MMSDPTTVDKTVADPKTGKLVLLIAENRSWSETAEMHSQLAAKVKTYVRYIRSPDFAKEHNRPAADTIVRLVSMEQPDQATVEYCARVRHELDKVGIGFEVRILRGTPAAAAPAAAPAPPAAPAAPSEPEPASHVGADVSTTQEPEVIEQPAPAEETYPGAESDLDTAADTEEYAETGAYIDTAASEDSAADEDAEDLSDIEFLSGSDANADLEEPVGVDIDRATFLPEEEFRSVEPARHEAAGSLGIIRVGEELDKVGEELDLSDASGAEADPFDLEAEDQPSLKGALAAAISSAIAGGLLWFGLAAASHQTASPLALAVGVMVGMSVRVRGAGTTTEFRIIALIGTAFGCLIGSLLAGAVVLANTGEAGFGELLGSVSTAFDTLDRAYTVHSLGAFAIALFLGFRLAAPKQEEADAL